MTTLEKTDTQTAREAAPPREGRDGALRELVAFRAAGQDFCVDIMSIREIRGFTAATIVPHAPDFVLGVMNLRGSVVPVVDLSRRLGLGATQGDDRHVIIIAMVGPQMTGLLVEAVSDILSIPEEEIRPTPEVASEVARSFIAGVICEGERLLRLIDLGRLLPAEEGDQP
ncbi:chemotaxis protein CheW [Acidimangrovimonas sediminis]|uniref:chemotaxis protein CheW n=1 Tax=Acidimangrovimonas sediminis TaxID=2056283 RepID=UPI000C80FF9B|nr:chemotaxis protein CheW [Acidimangrovimonas sediminis]